MKVSTSIIAILGLSSGIAQAAFIPPEDMVGQIDMTVSHTVERVCGLVSMKNDGGFPDLNEMSFFWKDESVGGSHSRYAPMRFIDNAEGGVIDYSKLEVAISNTHGAEIGMLKAVWMDANNQVIPSLDAMQKDTTVRFVLQSNKDQSSGTGKAGTYTETVSVRYTCS